MKSKHIFSVCFTAASPCRDSTHTPAARGARPRSFPGATPACAIQPRSSELGPLASELYNTSIYSVYPFVRCALRYQKNPRGYFLALGMLKIFPDKLLVFATLAYERFHRNALLPIHGETCNRDTIFLINFF